MRPQAWAENSSPFNGGDEDLPPGVSTSSASGSGSGSRSASNNDTGRGGLSFLFENNKVHLLNLMKKQFI